MFGSIFPIVEEPPRRVLVARLFELFFPVHKIYLSFFFLLLLVNLMNSDGSCRGFFVFLSRVKKLQKPRDFRESLSRRLKPAQHPYPSHHISIVLRELSTIYVEYNLFRSDCACLCCAARCVLCLCSSLVCVDLLLVV